MTRSYTSPVGFRTDTLPWRLWEKAKQLVWDPHMATTSSRPADASSAVAPYG
jgi:hypothetical protein